MNCINCKAEWTPPASVSITICPFCGKPLFEILNSEKHADPHEILLKIVQQYDKKILADHRLKSRLKDLLPHAEKKYHNVFKKAIEDNIGGRLLELEGEEHSGRIVKISTLRDGFKTRNGFDSTAYYIVDCFLYALGRIKTISIEQYCQVEIGNLSIINQQIDMAFIDGVLNRGEAIALFSSAKSLGISEDEAAE